MLRDKTDQHYYLQQGVTTDDLWQK